MNRLLTVIFSLAALLVILTLPARCSTEPLPPKDEYMKMVKIQQSKIGEESITRYFYGETLIKEVFIHGEAAQTLSKSKKAEWEDKGTRWECRESEGQRELKKTVIYKRGINQSGHMEGRGIDALFSPQFLFERGWDYGGRKLRARLIADSHILQILVVLSAPDSIEHELLFSDPELDIDRVVRLEDSCDGTKTLLHVLFKNVMPQAGSLVLFDSDGKQTLLGRKVTTVEISPSKRFCAFSAMDDQGQSTLEVYKIGAREPEFVKNMERSLVTSINWSPDEKFVLASISLGDDKKCARVDLKKGHLEECAAGACSLASSPACRFVVFAKKNQKYAAMKIVSVDRESRRAIIVNEKGSTSERALDEIADFSTLYCYDFESRREEKAGTALAPYLEGAVWSREEGGCYFLDGDQIYRMSIMTKGTALQAVAGLPGTGNAGDGRKLFPLEKDLFLVQVGDTIYRIKGFKSMEPFIQKAISFKVNDSGSELAYLVKARGGFGLSLFNLKNRDELSIIEGSREVHDYQWLARSAAVLRVILQPDQVRADDPVVIHFNDKGDEVPLEAK